MENKLNKIKSRITVANCLTFFRMVGSLYIVIARPMSYAFYIIYTLCGVSDVLDGYFARRTKSDGEFGAKLDSIADILFYSAMLLRIFPLLLRRLPQWIWYGVSAVLILRLCSYIIAALKFHRFASLHTYLNKLTGLMVFVLPYIIEWRYLTYYCILVCTAAGVSAMHELLIHLFSDRYQADRKTVRSSSK